jgi:hypothetical protein
LPPATRQSWLRLTAVISDGHFDANSESYTNGDVDIDPNVHTDVDAIASAVYSALWLADLHRSIRRYVNFHCVSYWLNRVRIDAS